MKATKLVMVGSLLLTVASLGAAPVQADPDYTPVSCVQNSEELSQANADCSATELILTEIVDECFANGAIDEEECGL